MKIKKNGIVQTIRNVEYIEIENTDKIPLVQVGFFDRNAKLVYKSIMEMRNLANRAKNNIITLILLLTIFISFFFARNLGDLGILLFFGLVIGAFALIKDYKERRKKNNEKEKDF